jgi:hypothetical protein
MSCRVSISASMTRKVTAFSNIEITFCVFLAENYFVKVLIQFIWVRQTRFSLDRTKPVKDNKYVKMKDPAYERGLAFYKEGNVAFFNMFWLF